VSSATPAQRHAVSDIYTTDHNRLPSVDCDAFGSTADVSGIKVWVIPLQLAAQVDDQCGTWGPFPMDTFEVVWTVEVKEKLSMGDIVGERSTCRLIVT
jgi:hypothetical protein